MSTGIPPEPRQVPARCTPSSAASSAPMSSETAATGITFG